MKMTMTTMEYYNELSVGDSSSWSKFHHQLEISREDLLKLDSETKLNILRKFIRNSDLDLHKLTLFELHKSTKKACSVVDEGEERIPFFKSVTVPKGNRSVREHIIKPCNKSCFTVPIDHTFTAEAPKAEKHITIRFKLNPPEKSFVSKPATSSLGGDYGDEIKKPITNEGKMVQKSEKVGSKRPRRDRDYGNEEKARRAKKRLSKMASVVLVVPDQQPPELPAKLKDLYKDRNISEAVLVIQKPLYRTDVSSGHGRLSLPLSQIRNTEFLSNEEKVFLCSRAGKETPQIPIKLIEPTNEENCRVYNINLRQWDMKKPSGKVNSVYNLVTGWNEFVKDNKLCEGMTVQIWAFRVDSELWLSFVRLRTD